MKGRLPSRTPASVFRSAASAGSRFAWLVRVGRHRHGLLPTLRLAFSEVAFDLLHGTDTGFEAEGPGLDGPPYESVNPFLLRRLLRRVPTGTGSFVDVGCGKGRALILSALAGFPSVIGVEVRPDRAAVARANLDRLRRRLGRATVIVHVLDAAAFDFPDDSAVILFFNPFGRATMRRVIARLDASLRASPRRLRVILVHPRDLDLFLGAGFVVRHREPGLSAILEARLANSVNAV